MAKPASSKKASNASASSSIDNEFVSAYLQTSSSLMAKLEALTETLRSGAAVKASGLNVSSDLLQLKRLNRAALTDAASCEADLEAAKRDTDEKRLQLANLLYEKEHLLREIQMAKELECKELEALEEAEGEVRRGDERRSRGLPTAHLAHFHTNTPIHSTKLNSTQRAPSSPLPRPSSPSSTPPRPRPSTLPTSPP